MEKPLGEHLSDWLEAGVLDRAQVERIIAFEQRRGLPPPSPGRSLLPVLASAFGVVLLGAGVLLFVAANWQHMAPWARFSAVLGMVGCFHLAGAFASGRAPRTATALHGGGTLALGGGIFLAGQIFNLHEHWPGGVLLWALGAWMGRALLRDWVQGLLAALLTPAWIMGEWVEATRDAAFGSASTDRVLALCVLGLATTYLTARLPGRDSLMRKALAWAGGLAFMPAALALIAVQAPLFSGARAVPWIPPEPLLRAGWAAALGGPLALAMFLRGRAAWMNLAAALWILALAAAASAGRGWAVHAVCALGAVGMILWGLREDRGERVNLGVAGFAVTLLAFYFSSIMDRLGRSLGLMGLGLLFLAGGWQLERLRRRLTARIIRGAP